MNARDLDLVLGGVAIAFAGVLARIADPATAIVILAIAFATLVACLGEERIEALWRAYCAEPAPQPAVRRPPPMPGGPHRPPRADRRRHAILPPARLVRTR